VIKLIKYTPRAPWCHQQVEGTLSVQPQANPVRGFEEYFLGLTVENNQRNPWFVGECLATYFMKTYLNY